MQPQFMMRAILLAASAKALERPPVEGRRNLKGNETHFLSQLKNDSCVYAFYSELFEKL